MKGFIEVTNSEGSQHLLNCSNIASVFTADRYDEKDVTFIIFRTRSKDGSASHVTVKETYAEVKILIENAMRA